MNIHEYQGKAVLKSFGAPVPRGFPAFTTEEALDAAAKLGGSVWAVKSQIHAGGRGKGKFKEADAGEKGGVRIAFKPEDVGALRQADARQHFGDAADRRRTAASSNASTSKKACKIAKEFYLSALVDREQGRVAFVVSRSRRHEHRRGRARHAGKDHHRRHRSARRRQQARTREKVAATLGLIGRSRRRNARSLITNLYEAFTKSDMSLLEINPLIVTEDDKLLCGDAKVSFDSNAAFRHKEWADLRDLGEEDEREIEASKYDLSYIALDGEIGCLVNGAGLAMATMDIIKLFGAEPANFLDVGGGADKNKVEAAFKIILADPKVKGILVNIFGGIARCDVIAEGVIAAVKSVGLQVPLVVRLEGTNVERRQSHHPQ